MTDTATDTTKDDTRDKGAEKIVAAALVEFQNQIADEQALDDGLVPCTTYCLDCMLITLYDAFREALDDMESGK